MRTLVISLLVALALTVAAPATYDFPRRETPYVRPERTTAPGYLRPVTHAQREAQIHTCRPVGMGLSWPRTDLVWDGPDLLFTTPEGRFRATFSDFRHQAQTVTREPTTD